MALTQIDRPEYLTPPEVAAIVRVHPETVRRWMRSGRLPFARIGLRKLVPRSELRRLLEPESGEVT